VGVKDIVETLNKLWTGLVEYTSVWPEQILQSNIKGKEELAYFVNRDIREWVFNEKGCYEVVSTLESFGIRPYFKNIKVKWYDIDPTRERLTDREPPSERELCLVFPVGYRIRGFRLLNETEIENHVMKIMNPIMKSVSPGALTWEYEGQSNSEYLDCRLNKNFGDLLTQIGPTPSYEYEMMLILCFDKPSIGTDTDEQSEKIFTAFNLRHK
jgi:hypothetical protein